MDLPGLVEMYQRLWGLAAEPVRWPAGLSARERAVVTLLAEGCTDQTVADQLGLSRRTITYTVADLMENYGARSRFHLALLLAGADTGIRSTRPESSNDLRLEF